MLLLPFNKLACKRYASLLVPYHERSLPGPERSLVAAHLRLCASCRKEVANLALMSDLLRANPPAVSNTDLWSSLETQIRATPQESPSPLSLPSYPARQGWRLSASQAGLVAATLVLGVALYQRNPASVDSTPLENGKQNKQNLVAILPHEAQPPFVLKTTESLPTPLATPTLRSTVTTVLKPTQLRANAPETRVASISRKGHFARQAKFTAAKSAAPSLAPQVDRVGIKVASLSVSATAGAKWGIKTADIEDNGLSSYVDTMSYNGTVEVNSMSAEAENVPPPAIQRTVPATAAFASNASESAERQRALFSYSGG